MDAPKSIKWVPSLLRWVAIQTTCSESAKSRTKPFLMPYYKTQTLDKTRRCTKTYLRWNESLTGIWWERRLKSRMHCQGLLLWGVKWRVHLAARLTLFCRRREHFVYSLATRFRGSCGNPDQMLFHKRTLRLARESLRGRLGLREGYWKYVLWNIRQELIWPCFSYQASEVGTRHRYASFRRW